MHPSDGAGWETAGGMPGAERLRDSEALQAMLVAHTDSGRLITAICAAPVSQV